MITDKILQGDVVYLRSCQLEDVTDEYVSWLNDETVNQYLETRFSEQTTETVYTYVKRMIESEKDYLFAIIDKKDEKHIGNLHISMFPVHNRCEIAAFIGDKRYWGNGRPVDYIKIGTKFAFEELQTDWIGGGIYASNIFSLKAILKAGYKQEGYRRSYVFVGKEGKRDDVYLVGMTKEDFYNQKRT